MGGTQLVCLMPKHSGRSWVLKQMRLYRDALEARSVRAPQPEIPRSGATPYTRKEVYCTRFMGWRVVETEPGMFRFVPWAE